MGILKKVKEGIGKNRVPSRIHMTVWAYFRHDSKYRSSIVLYAEKQKDISTCTTKITLCPIRLGAEHDKYLFGIHMTVVNDCYS